MSRRIAFPAAVLVMIVLAAAWYLSHDHTALHYTGFVEGEERVIRSEVSGRVLEVPYAEGASVPADGVLARLDDRDIQTRLKSKEQELAVLDAESRAQEERIRLIEGTWVRERDARRADVQQAEAGAGLAERTLEREQRLVATGASTAQLLDDRRAGRDQARSTLEHARQMAARTDAEERNIALARRDLETLHEKRTLTVAQLEELQVTAAKYVIHAPGVPTVVQTQLVWPGELAQPGTGIAAVLDPTDKYVQVYVPVADVDRFRVGRRVEIELDSEPGRRIPGEVSFVADKANFTPEKIETRSDRLGQVYRAKVRILEGVERAQPGTEGNVYLGRDGATG